MCWDLKLSGHKHKLIRQNWFWTFRWLQGETSQITKDLPFFLPGSQKFSCFRINKIFFKFKIRMFAVFFLKTTRKEKKSFAFCAFCVLDWFVKLSVYDVKNSPFPRLLCSSVFLSFSFIGCASSCPVAVGLTLLPFFFFLFFLKETHKSLEIPEG